MKFFDWQIPAEKGLLFTYLSRIFLVSVWVTEIHDKFVLIKSASNKHEFLVVCGGLNSVLNGRLKLDLSLSDFGENGQKIALKAQE